MPEYSCEEEYNAAMQDQADMGAANQAAADESAAAEADAINQQTHDEAVSKENEAVEKQSDYSDAEKELIICITRTRDCKVGDCKVGDCKTCGWKPKHEYETIDGKWWLFEDGKPIRPLTDDEARKVIWG